MNVAIIGGSLGGLAAANVFHRLGARVRVFEKSPSRLDKRGACLGFVDVELWERIRGAPLTWPDGRPVTRTPPPDGRQSFENQGSFYYGDMWNFLYAGLPEGCVTFGCEVDTLGADANNPSINGEAFDLAIISDGGFSTLRAAYFDAGRQPEYAGYQIFWGRCDVEDCGPDILRSFDGRTELIGPYAAVPLPVPCFDGRKTYMCAFFVATPEDEVERPRKGDNRQIAQVSGHGNAPEWFLPFVRHLFGEEADASRKRSPGVLQWSAADEIVRFTEAAATKGKITASPVFEFGVSTTVAGRIVVMGDAAHMASPMTAAGAHTAMEDALGLWEAFSQPVDRIEDALRLYDKGGIQRTKRLLRASRAVSKDLVPSKVAIKSPSTLLSKQHTSVADTTPKALPLV